MINPAYTIDDFKKRYEDMSAFVQECLKEGVEAGDYGLIPGTKNRVLLKGGAEKLATFYGLVPTFRILNAHRDFSANDFQYEVECTLTDESGRLVAVKLAAASTTEDKYRLRKVREEDMTEEDFQNVEKFTEKTYGTKVVKTYYLRNMNGDVINTVLQMAEKRAFVGAVIMVANAGNLFTDEIAFPSNAPKAYQPTTAKTSPPAAKAAAAPARAMPTAAPAAAAAPSPAPAPAKAAKPAQAAAKPAPAKEEAEQFFVEGVVTHVSSKPTARGGTRWGFKVADIWVNSFDAAVAEVGEFSKGESEPVRFTYVETPYGKDVVGVAYLNPQAAAPAPEEAFPPAESGQIELDLSPAPADDDLPY